MDDRMELNEQVDRLMAGPLPPLLTVRRVAAMLDMAPRRVYELIEMGDLVAVRVGTRGRRVFRDSLEQWLRRGGSGPG
jgi:excisionase family DNA binding protein